VARRLPELPLIHDAFAHGELSYSKVRALTRVADADSEQELLELARELTAAQLERAVRAFRRVTTAEANNQQADAYLTTFWDDDGSLFLQGRLAPEDGALFLRGLEAARDTLWERGRGSAEPPPRPRNADALLVLAEAALASPPERSGGERYQVVVHVDLDTLAAESRGGCALADGPALAAETARRIACDASVVALGERNGTTLSVGRKTRTIPPSLRRALRVRDRGCRFPGCERQRFLDAHHVQHWAHGGETAIENLLLLCGRHHRLVHEGGYTVNERLRFHDPWGEHIPPVWKPPPGDAAELLRDERAAAIGSRTCANGSGDPMDLDLAVEALLRAHSRC
jgi:hypothetical protein